VPVIESRTGLERGLNCNLISLIRLLSSRASPIFAHIWYKCLIQPSSLSPLHFRINIELNLRSYRYEARASELAGNEDKESSNFVAGFLRPLSHSSPTIGIVSFVLLCVVFTLLSAAFLFLIGGLLLDALFSQDFSTWDPCPEFHLFTVDRAFGSFSYDEVKIIDAAWNLVVGRGLQALAAWACYKIFGMALLRITEKS